MLLFLQALPERVICLDKNALDGQKGQDNGLALTEIFPVDLDYVCMRGCYSVSLLLWVVHGFGVQLTGGFGHPLP